MGRAHLIKFTLLIAVAYLGFEHGGAVIRLYHAAYPDDRIKREALDQCAQDIRNFSRLDSADRDRCYAASSNRLGALTDNPSHLPVNDVRRQETFDNYRAMQGPAAAVSMVPPPDRAYKP
jgi:hypothetical protein